MPARAGRRKRGGKRRNSALCASAAETAPIIPAVSRRGLSIRPGALQRGAGRNDDGGQHEKG
ncbi:MAG TPA: hypothetical protein PKC95_07800, partial [Thauera aminoaromatica]|nr:hypothetical protein [Thauera aminoaromatica]